MSVKRVLIFDSGVGGLSVYQEVIKINPSIHCHYLFDNAYFPYGELEHSQLIQRVTQLLKHFLQSHPVDLIVLACNSASTVALASLRATFSIPIVGVVPAIKPAALVTKNNVIGLLATPATIARTYTSSLINEFASDKQVLRIGSTALVNMAEDKLSGQTVDHQHLCDILSPWLSDDVNLSPDTLVLGCTHFPLLKDEIAACFNSPVQLVDSGLAIALRVQQLLLTNTPSKLNIAENLPQQAFYTQEFSDLSKLNALRTCFSQHAFSALHLF